MNTEKRGIVKSYMSGVLRAWVTAILVLVQFGILMALSFLMSSYTIYIYYFFQLLGIVLIIGLVNDNRSASYKIAWISIIMVFSITGYLMYYLWGRPVSRKKFEKKIFEQIRYGSTFLETSDKVKSQLEQVYPSGLRIANFMESHQFPLFQNNRLTYYPMGEDVFEAIFEEIEKAEKFILIQFFIVGEGVLWDRMHDILTKKIEEGVEVLFLYDDFGAMFRTDNHFDRRLELEGFKVRVFNPVHKYTDRLYMNYRTHQKIIVVDGNIGFTGGMNLADEYVNLVDRFGIWKDNAVRVIGDAVWGLTVVFLQMWTATKPGDYIDYTIYRPTIKFEPSEVFCQVISDGPVNNPSNPIEAIYRQLIYTAKNYLYITTPYLVLEDDMRDALIHAVLSGVDVRIITPGIPDKKTVKCLTNYNYGRLLEAGVKIYEYTPGFLHAKTIIADDFGIVGTINMDYRSFYLHYECGVFMYDKDTVAVIKKDLEDTIAQCRGVSYGEWLNRPLKMKLAQRILNMFSTLA